MSVARRELKSLRFRRVHEVPGAERHVLVVAYDGAELVDISCVTTGLDAANRVGARPRYRVRLVSLGGRSVRCDSGIELRAQGRLEDPVDDLDTLVVCGGLGHEGAADDARLVDHVRRLATNARRVASVCTGATVLAATREHGLEGVVAKRLGSPYLPGARNGAWVKHKHRRTESFLVSGWSPAERRRRESLLLARPRPDGSLEPAGSVPFVVAGGQADEVRRKLETLVLPPTRRGQRIRRLAPEVRAVVAFHGPTRGPVRDPILRALAPPEPPRSS